MSVAEQNAREVYARLRAYIWPHWPMFLLAIIGMAMFASVDTGYAYLVKHFLDGAFVDNQKCYRAGDFACLGDGVAHRPITGPAGRCVSLIMVRDDPHYTTMLGRLAAPFVKL